MKTVTTSGKRKRAIARATVKAGTGKVRVNKVDIAQYEPKIYRLKLQEPLFIASDLASKVDVSINVNGGGMASQADASRLALGKALAEFAKSAKVKEQLLAYDRSLLVADVRRKEPAKPNRRGQARSKRQKSYR